MSLRDIPATIADLASFGADPPFPGSSLARFWHEPGTIPAEAPVLSEIDGSATLTPLVTQVPAALGPMHSIAIDGWISIRNGDGCEELYDFRSDPDQRHDLAPRSTPRPTWSSFEASSGG